MLLVDAIMDTHSIFTTDGPYHDFSSGLSNRQDDLFSMLSGPTVPEPCDRSERRKGYMPNTFVFYEGPKKCECCKNWVEKTPTQIPDTAKDKYDSAAILLFKGKNHKSPTATMGGLIALEDAFLKIQSEIIGQLITPVLGKFGFLVPKNKVITIKSPFRELFHSYEEIIAVRRRHEMGTDEYTHLTVLIDAMDELFATFSDEVRELHARKMITFDHLWTLFPKGIIVYTRRDGHDRLFQVEKIESQMHWSSNKPRLWVLTCRYIQFDGIKLGWVERLVHINHFDGIDHILNLQVYPVGFHSDAEMEQKIKSRGARVVEFQGISHCEYLGRGVTRSQGNFDSEDDEDMDSDMRRLRSRPIESFWISGRVIIDPYGYKKYNPGLAPNVRRVNTTMLDSESHEIHQSSNHEVSGRGSFEAEEKGRLSENEQESSKRSLMKEPEHLLLLNPLLPGYSLTRNKWLWFSIDCLKPIKWNHAAFDTLVIPNIRKSLLFTFVHRHSSVGRINGDFVAGKGQGLVVMLSGPPGTGKTLTAEAVAERAQKPLFRFQIENMGTGAVSFNKNLAESFELCTDWDALMLVDDADAVLCQRTPSNNEQNRLVAALFRQLEYYRGIIFLTTNLENHIDEAFQSRIHFHLRYPALSKESRQKIWTNYLKRIEILYERSKQSHCANAQLGITTPAPPGYNIQPEDSEKLARWKLNGREIKNVVKTVYLWCHYNRFELALARIEDGIGFTAPLATKDLDEVGDTEIARKRARLE